MTTMKLPLGMNFYSPGGMSGLLGHLRILGKDILSTPNGICSSLCGSPEALGSSAAPSILIPRGRSWPSAHGIHKKGPVKIDILKSRKGIGEPPNRPSGRRRLCAVRVLCRRQNLGAGGIHFCRAFESPKGGATLRAAKPKTKGHLQSRCPFLWHTTTI